MTLHPYTLILGLDPGTATTGFGLIEKRGPELKILDYGCIKTKTIDPLETRLDQIAVALVRLLKKYQPDVCSLEELFFAKNTKTALKVAQARGVIMQTIQHQHIPIYHYTPLQIKIAITGYGRASKKQIQVMTKLILSLSQLPRPDDAADALACAICHSRHNRLLMAKKGAKLSH